MVAAITQLSAVISLGAISAMAQPILTDEAGFTEYVASQLRNAVGDSAVVVAGPLTIKLGSLQANLDRVFAFCNRKNSACSMEVATYVKGVAETYKSQGAALSASAVRFVIRTALYVRQMQVTLKEDASPLPRPFVDDLVLLPVLDSPRTVRMLNVRDIQALGLSEDQVQQLALANMRDAGRGRIGQLVGDSYNPSRLALLDTWAPLANAQNGKLIVVAPATDTVFYIGDDSATAIDALRTLAHNVMAGAPHPLSESLLRWKPAGWEVVR
jgi:hypothetical protein